MDTRKQHLSQLSVVDTKNIGGTFETPVWLARRYVAERGINNLTHYFIISLLFVVPPVALIAVDSNEFILSKPLRGVGAG